MDDLDRYEDHLVGLSSSISHWRYASCSICRINGRIGGSPRFGEFATSV